MLKKYFFAAILFQLTMNLSAQSHLTQKLEEFLKTVQTEFAPDKRVALFESTVLVRDGQVIIQGETTEPGAVQAIKKYIAAENLPVQNDVLILPSSEIEKKYGIVTISVANLRKQSEHASEMVSQALMGTVVRIFKKHGGWVLVKTPDNYLGWIEDDGLVFNDGAEIGLYLKSKRLLITSLHPYCYQKASEKSELVSDLTCAAIVQFAGTSGSWYKVQLPDGRIGYIKKSSAVDLKEYFTKLKFSGSQLIATAKRFLGTPYLWGGSSSKGLDCSGFTKTVYFLNGIILSRDASQQVLQGALVDTVIDAAKLEPGDLTFYGRRNSQTGERATHVGLYLGNKEFIHSSGRVRINSYDAASPIYSEYRTKQFLRAKRITGLAHEQIITVLESPFYFPVKELP
ncbi:MAG: C40 family peptidase [Ignavibacteriales bacterium]|nr:C40 family peptidase [Ignavibacteriales bacterium]